MDARSPAFATVRAGEPFARLYGPAGAFLDVLTVEQLDARPDVQRIDLRPPGPAFDGWAVRPSPPGAS